MSVILYIGVLVRLRLLFDDSLPSEGRQLSGLWDCMQSIIRFVLIEIERFWNNPPPSPSPSKMLCLWWYTYGRVHCKWIPIYSVPNYSPEILGSPNFGTMGSLALVSWTAFLLFQFVITVGCTSGVHLSFAREIVPTQVVNLV